MENKRTLLLVVAFLAFIILWQLGTSWFATYMGWDMTIREEQSTEVVETNVGTDGETTINPTTQSGLTATTQAADPVAVEGVRVEGGEAQVLTLGSDAKDGDFTMQVKVNTVGAGFEEVRLNRFAAEVGEPASYTFETPYADNEDTSRPLATQSVLFNGRELDLSDVAWKINADRTSDRQAELYVNLVDGETRVGQIRKRISLAPRLDANGEDDLAGGYEVLVRHTIDNLSGASAKVALIFNGTTTPPRELETGYDRTILRGSLSESGRVKYEAEQVESFDEEDPLRIYRFSEQPLAWAGSGTIYFNAIVRPADPKQFDRVIAEALNPDSKGEDRRVGLRFETKEQAVAAGEQIVVPAYVFLGPKKRQLLENGYYSAAGIEYDSTLVSPFGCTWCVFQPVVDALVFLLGSFHFFLRDWGLAIIALVCLVRLLLHPITKRAQRNMLRMSKLAPKIAAAKEKYGDDKQKMAQAMAELAPEQTQALLLGCLPMMLQTPIWIALYSTLQATIELRGAPFLYGYTWIDDLARPDHLIDFGQRYELFFGIGISGLNLLPLLMGVAFYIQMKLQPQPTQAMSDEQKAQQKMIQVIMVTLFPLFLYSAPSGLVLYILTSTIIGVFETRRIRHNLKLEEEAEEAKAAEDLRLGRTPVEKPKTGLAKKLDGFKKTIATRVAEAQKQAEVAQKSQKPRKK